MIVSRLVPVLAVLLALAAPSARADEATGERAEKAVDMVEEFMKDFDRAQSERSGQRLEVDAGTMMNGGDSLAMLANVRDVLGLPKVELSAAEGAQLERLIQLMPKLAGPSRRFDHADLEPILKTLEEDLAREVGAEIVRQASAKVQPGSFGESLRRRAVEEHLAQHGEAYLKHGMEEARRRVREGLGQYFHRTGTASAAPEPEEMRTLTLDELRQFSQDVRVLEAVSRRSAERGLPRFTFPNGMSVEDLRAIREGQPPPNGKLTPRR